jgi:peptidyl-prolyl cis-trans isomerase C
VRLEICWRREEVSRGLFGFTEARRTPPSSLSEGLANREKKATKDTNYVKGRLRTEIFRVALTALVMLSGSGMAQQEQKAAKKAGDPVVMRVGERGVTIAELCTAIGQLPPPQRQGYAMHPGLAKDWYGPLVALANEARREHLQAPADGNLREVDSDNALVGNLIQAIARETQPTDAQIENYYVEHRADFEQVRARHILISDAGALASRSNRSAAEAKTKAENIVAELKRGADFARLAAENSDDSEAKKGGELGYISHHQLEPAVDARLWSLAAGETSAAFEGRFGYEIVQVEERHTQPLDSVRQLIRGNFIAAGLEERQKAIVAAAHITMEPKYGDSPLPCEASVPAFTFQDPPLMP